MFLYEKANAEKALPIKLQHFTIMLL